tara:strand:- start:2271 stop:2516 length:246 start_codon:yes stop_codon:yes gene_type:complete
MINKKNKTNFLKFLLITISLIFIIPVIILPYLNQEELDKSDSNLNLYKKTLKIILNYAKYPIINIILILIIVIPSYYLSLY